jgi:hypothetical protein
MTIERIEREGESGPRVVYGGETAGESARDSAATKLIGLAKQCEFFHDVAREGYAEVCVNGHRETMRVGSKSFREYLSLQFFRSEKKAPSPQALASAIHTIEAQAVFEGSRKDVHVRVADADGDLWLDLGNDAWEAVHITRSGWALVQNPPIKFVRRAGMLPLPRPEKGRSLREMMPRFVTISEDALVLVRGYQLGCLRGRGPYPILSLVGEQGSGKTTLSRLIKRTLDPSKAATRCLPKDERDLMIAAGSQHILALDNLSYIDEQMSDALCRLATGGGLSTRTLYTDRDETIFDSERPIILNAIEDVAVRADLVDRSIIVSVPPLEDSRRKPEREFWDDFEKAHPFILGALCEAASLALNETKSLPVPAVRMTDFALFVSRGETALGLERGAFLRAYSQNRRDANETAVEFSTVAQALIDFRKDFVMKKWTGNATQLLAELNAKVSDDVRRSREWPKTPRSLSGKARRVAANLRGVGIAIKFPDDHNREPGTGQRLLEIESRDTSSQPPHTSQPDGTVTDEDFENQPDAIPRDGCDRHDANPESASLEAWLEQDIVNECGQCVWSARGWKQTKECLADKFELNFSHERRRA